MIETIHNKHIERLRKINDNKIDDQYQLVELETKHRNLTKKYNFLNNDYQNIELQLTDYSNRLNAKDKEVVKLRLQNYNYKNDLTLLKKRITKK